MTPWTNVHEFQSNVQRLSRTRLTGWWLGIRLVCQGRINIQSVVNIQSWQQCVWSYVGDIQPHDSWCKANMIAWGSWIWSYNKMNIFIIHYKKHWLTSCHGNHGCRWCINNLTGSPRSSTGSTSVLKWNSNSGSERWKSRLFFSAVQNKKVPSAEFFFQI